MFRYRIATVLILFTAICIAMGWYVDHTHLKQIIEEQKHPITWYLDKHDYWSPSLLLSVDTETLEANLSEQIPQFSGNIVDSSQGMSSDRLRQPSIETVDSVVALLDVADSQTRLNAARLLALYLEAVSGRSNTDPDSIRIRAYVHANAQTQVAALLQNDDPDIRAAGALCIGNFYYSRELEQLMMEMFEQEEQPTVKHYLAWAHHHIAD